MVTRFKIDYHTRKDELVKLEFQGKKYSMSSLENPQNQTILIINDNKIVRYRYSTEEREEWGKDHSLHCEKGVKSCCVIDRWQEIPTDSSFYSSIFTKSIFKRKNPTYSTLKSGSMMISVDSPCIESCQDLILVGSSEQLGSWEVEKGVKMNDGEFPRFLSPSLEISNELFDSEFKFVIVDRSTKKIIAWEEGENRNFSAAKGVKEESILLNLNSTTFNLKPWRGAGVAIPVFSLRSNQSMGIGDFMDLKMMGDWAAETNQRVIQILPINDTTMFRTWEDSYPYNANSIFALHPQYLSVTTIGEISDKNELQKFKEEGFKLNSLQNIDYEAVNNLKKRYLRILYAEIGEKMLKSNDFIQFFKENSYWLESYALYSLLRDKYSTATFTHWGDEAIYSEELLSKYRLSHPNELGYYYFVQYNLHKQLLDARNYAQSRGVAFKGDIPIGVSRSSVDVWVSPKLFNLSSQAGAPPDDFSVLGQNWGFPTYNWSEMAKDGYQWWIKRFQKMSEYFDAYRIDHILGFFRIWEIPSDAVYGLLGHFSPAMPYSTIELREIYGFEFEKSFVEPSINQWVLNELFKDREEEIKLNYFDKKESENFSLKPQFNTQAKINSSVDEQEICNKLMMLLCEVLFVEDPYKKGHYHPRIAAKNSYKYRAMSSQDKERYDALYNNFYYHRHNDFWLSESMKKLPILIKSTEMLTCGEDLGMIPSCVPEVMKREQILSLEIERMPKNPALEFDKTELYPYLSVCTTSTHDMNPIRAWLLEDKEISSRYYRDILTLGNHINNDISGEICSIIVERHLKSPAMWTILPLQDWLSIDEKLRRSDPLSERINIPAFSRHYWRYRAHITVEELINSKDFNNKIGSMIKNSGR